VFVNTVLALEGVSKVFPKVVACEDIELDLKLGEVHAVLGENGAGKSTLMNCIYGLYKPTDGRFFVREQEVTIGNSEEAIRLGIGMVHQHFMLVPQLTVAENIILGLPSSREPFLRLDEAEQKIRELSDRYNFGIDPKQKVKNLSVGIQQRVEILKVLYRKAEILILDEATAVLTPQETQEIFDVIRQLVTEGKSVLMITHKLEEVMALSDRVTVLRDGRVSGRVKTSETNPNELATMMVGREVLFDFKDRGDHPGDIYLEVADLTLVDEKHVTRVDDVSFNIRSGEILGIAGVDGNGQIELSEALTGMRHFQKGKVSIKGKEFSKLNARELYESGVSHIPQDRHHTGLILELSVNKNLILTDNYLPPYSKYGIIDYKKVNSHGEEMIHEYDVRTPSGDVPVRELSGGNQQKIILARELCRNPDILIAVQPTRGLDIGATEFVRQKLIDQRTRGAAVLLVSTELDEILQVADRIAVMYKGHFMGIVRKGEVTVNQIGLMMAGATKEEAMSSVE
jgi:general nucleoside transport system ATP-binding protein